MFGKEELVIVVTVAVVLAEELLSPSQCPEHLLTGLEIATYQTISKGLVKTQCLF